MEYERSTFEDGTIIEGFLGSPEEIGTLLYIIQEQENLEMHHHMMQMSDNIFGDIDDDLDFGL